MAKWRVLLRDDSGFPNVRTVEAIVQSDESISTLQGHAHIVEVLGSFDGTCNEKQLEERGFTTEFETKQEEMPTEEDKPKKAKK